MMLILFPSEGCWSPVLHLMPAACPLLGRVLLLLFVNPGSNHFRSDTAPTVYPCKGDGRKVFAALNSGYTFSQPRLEQSSVCGIWGGERSVHAKKASLRAALLTLEIIH